MPRLSPLTPVLRKLTRGRVGVEGAGRGTKSAPGLFEVQGAFAWWQSVTINTRLFIPEGYKKAQASYTRQRLFASTGTRGTSKIMKQ